MITVGIPVWNSKEIAWLPMESLCRQQTRERWELIIYEEEHPQKCGQEFFDSYLDRLRGAGCVSLRYLTSKQQQPLSYKWAEMGRAADRRSRMFCICDADNYYQKYMIQDSAEAHRQGYDWLTARKGYFYNFISGVLAKYSLHERPEAKTGLQMTMATKLMRNLPHQERHRYLNAWVFNNAKPQTIKNEGSNFNTLCTHGCNNISNERGEMIDSFQMPFYKTDKKLEDIVPPDIAERIKKL
jgi:hypothetical protein